MPTIRLQNIAGIASRLASDDARKQPPDRDGRLFVDVLEDGYVTDDGKVKALPSTQTAATGVQWANGISAPCGLIVHDRGAGTLVLDPKGESPTTLVTGLADAEVAFVEHQGFVWWTDGVSIGRITADGTTRPGTLPSTSAPSVSAPTGALPAGVYLIGYTWVDSTGMEGPCAALAKATLEVEGGLAVNVAAFPSDVTGARLYCTTQNGKELRLVGTYTAGQFPVTISAEPASKETMFSLGLSPLPPGDGLTTRGGFLLSWSGTELSHSRGDFTALTNLAIDYHQFPSTILGAVGVENGVWVSTERGMYWLAGKDLTQATVSNRQDTRTYAIGGFLVPPEMTGLETGLPCAAFASDEGPVYGTADGQLIAPYAQTQKWDVAGKTATCVVWQPTDTKLLVLGVSD